MNCDLGHSILATITYSGMEVRRGVAIERLHGSGEEGGKGKVAEVEVPWMADKGG